MCVLVLLACACLQALAATTVHAAPVLDRGNATHTVENSTAAPLANDPSLDYKFKLVENMFCKGLGGDCEELESWTEVQKQQQAKIDERLRNEAEAAKTARLAMLREAQKAAQRFSAAYADDGSLFVSPGALYTHELMRYPLKHKQVVRQGEEEGGPHSGSRLPAFYPHGFGTVPKPASSDDTDTEETAATHTPKKYTAGPQWERWVTTANRFPHQREAHQPTLQQKKDLPTQANPAAKQNAAQQTLAQSAAHVTTAPAKGDSRQLFEFLLGVSAKADGVQSVLSNQPVESRHAGDVHHYDGFKLSNLNTNPYSTDLDVFDHPRHNYCDHRFSFRCQGEVHYTSSNTPSLSITASPSPSPAASPAPSPKPSQKDDENDNNKLPQSFKRRHVSLAQRLARSHPSQIANTQEFEAGAETNTEPANFAMPAVVQKLLLADEADDGSADVYPENTSH